MRHSFVVLALSAALSLAACSKDEQAAGAPGGQMPPPEVGVVVMHKADVALSRELVGRLEVALGERAHLAHGAGGGAALEVAQDLLQLAGLMAKGRAAHLRGDYQAAIGFYTAATEIEGRLSYNEPAFWYQPVAQSLGASLYEDGRLSEARATFRKALVQSPDSGWALYGLAATERKLGNTLEAKAAEAALERNWLGERRWLRMNRL